MKKTFIAAAVLALSAFAATAAGTDTPRIDQRQANQEQRIDKGIASGELTKPEARRMNRQQNGGQPSRRQGQGRRRGDGAREEASDQGAEQDQPPHLPSEARRAGPLRREILTHPRSG